MNKPHPLRRSRSVLPLLLALLLASCASAEPPAPRPAAMPVSPTASASIAPAALLARALAARSLGDYDAEATDLRVLIAQLPEAPEARSARYYLAESHARRGRWQPAIAALGAFVATGPADALAAQARFWLARSYEASGEAGRAAATYASYRALATPLEPYAALGEARQLEQVGRLADAATAYEHVANVEDLPRAERASALEHAIRVRRAPGDTAGALALYERLLALATLPDYRAHILAEAAALAGTAGEAERARTWQRTLVEQYPTSAEAADAVPTLLAAGAIAPAVAAPILFAAERYAAALPLFDQAIAGTTGDASLELRRQHALCLRALDQWQPALDELEAVAGAAPVGEVGRQARLDWVQTLGQSGAPEQAIADYRAYADSYPDDSRAPEALRRAAELLERAGDAAGATQQRLDLGQRFPQSAQAPAALHAAALARFQQGDWQAARAAWQLVADSAAEPLERVRAAYWAARAAQQGGDSAAAAALFAQARAQAPDSYYGARAAKQLDLDQPAPRVALDAPIAANDWLRLGQWVSDTFKLKAVPPITGALPASLAQSGPITRALALAEVGLGEQALAEWGVGRARAADDPAALLLLARLAYERAVPAVALAAAQQLLDGAPAGAAPPPDALVRLRYPAPWPALVRASAAEQQVDPLLLYALVRQESSFDPTDVSSAGARGLAQIMPETAQGVARQLNVADFQLDALDTPATSVRFGAYYLAQQLRAMGGSTHAGLAAYNGGPGNAERWREPADPAADPDLFVELIDYGETRAYVKLVYANYQVYQRLYRSDAN